jgi:PAS domain S-box-containing protein
MKPYRKATGKCMKQAFDSRLISGEEYRNIFEAASDRLVLYDIGLDSIVEVNPAACKMHGYTRQEFIGLNAAVFMLPGSHALFMERVRTAEPGSMFESLLVYIHRDSSPFHVEVRRSVINFRGRPCLLSIIRDVIQPHRSSLSCAAQPHHSLPPSVLQP